uniref:Uncharacterized protein n=1 Tax=Hucho hucho TaxID=62062 RepID=A0A4W5KJB0_9TELE
MSTAKDRMRDKKMRNQPINVTYSSQGSSHWRNGGDTPTGRGRGHGLSPHPRGQGSSHSGHAQRGGWPAFVMCGVVPHLSSASAFAKARAAEVNAMLTAITKTTGSSHVFGALPKHMRRRAMSHNTRRLPCRLRDTANNMVGLSTESSVSPYTQDMSYYCCVELQGPEEQLLATLSKLTSKEAGEYCFSCSLLTTSVNWPTRIMTSYRTTWLNKGQLAYLYLLAVPHRRDTPRRPPRLSSELISSAYKLLMLLHVVEVVQRSISRHNTFYQQKKHTMSKEFLFLLTFVTLYHTCGDLFSYGVTCMKTLDGNVVCLPYQSSLCLQDVNRLRNDVLVPGSRLPTPLQGRVPVLLVQQSGKSQGTEMGSWGTGWDLLLPKAWGMAFWVPLVWTTHSLRQLSAWCRPTSSKCQRARNLGSTPQLNRNVAASLLSAHGGSRLVWTRLSLLTKGQPEQHALVCVPTAEDLQLVRKEPGCTGPQEPLHTDHFKSRVKRPRKKDHNKPGTSSANLTTPSSFCTSALTLGLWPEPLPSVTSHCSRVTLGWVTQGDFSLSAGCGEALGLLSLTGLLHTLLRQPDSQRGLVLLRNSGSLQYRFAKINVEV